jgi:hypothetical protein
LGKKDTFNKSNKKNFKKNFFKSYGYEKNAKEQLDFIAKENSFIFCEVFVRKKQKKSLWRS